MVSLKLPFEWKYKVVSREKITRLFALMEWVDVGPDDSFGHISYRRFQATQIITNVQKSKTGLAVILYSGADKLIFIRDYGCQSGGGTSICNVLEKNRRNRSFAGSA